MNIGINAGHTKTGPGSGANGIINESNETRAVSAPLMGMLRAAGHNVVDCTIGTAPSQNSCLSQIVNMANRDDLGYFMSNEFNAGGGRVVEVYTY
ncbi:N-acetylmuramoyl-L-alanine amidase, partial [Enterobacter asburiae]